MCKKQKGSHRFAHIKQITNCKVRIYFITKILAKKSSLKLFL